MRFRIEEHKGKLSMAFLWFLKPKMRFMPKKDVTCRNILVFETYLETVTEATLRI